MMKSPKSESPVTAEQNSQSAVECNAESNTDPIAESKEKTDTDLSANVALEEKAEVEKESDAPPNELNSEEKAEKKTEEVIQPVTSTIPEVVHTVDDIYDFDDISGNNEENR